MALFDRKDNEKNEDDVSGELGELIESLGSKDWKIRENAAIRLTEIGKPAIVPLLKALDSDNTLVQTGAAEVLGTYGEAALPTLFRLVTTGKERVRDGAARAIGQNGDRALVLIKEALPDKNYRARRGAVLSLGYLGYLGEDVENMLVSALEDSNEKVRRQAAASLENINWKPKRRAQKALFFNAKDDLDSLAKLGTIAIPVLQKEALSGNSDKKKKIAAILPGIKDDEALILLISLLGDSDPEVRKKAAEAAGDCADSRLSSHLVKALSDPDSYVRMEVVWALDKTGWKPSKTEDKARYLIVKEKWTDLLQMRETAIPYLIETLKDENPGVRLKSTEVLSAMGNIGYAAINEALRSEDPLLKKAAAEAAAHIKRKKSAAKQPKKDGRKRSPDEDIEEQIKRQKASMASRSTESEEFWAALMRKYGLDEEKTARLSRALSDYNEIVRAAAVENLKTAGSAGTECMIALLKDKKSNVRIAAIESLGDIRAKKAAPYIIRFCRDKNENIRMACAHSLGQIREIKTLPQLIKLFSDKNSGVRTEASDSAAHFGSIALKLLQNEFSDQDMTVRITAIRTIGKIDDTASISLCVRMLNDSEYDVRECAISALKKLSETQFNPLIDESQRILIQGTKMEKSGIITALAGIEDLRAKEAILTFETDDDETIRNYAVRILKGEQADHKVVPVRAAPRGKSGKKTKSKISEDIRGVIADLKSEDSTVQMKAAEKVFMIGDDIIEPLIGSLDGSTPDFQNFASEILIGLGDNAVKGLINALNTGPSGLKIIVAQNLGKIPDKITMNALCQVLYNESDPVVRKVAAESLGYMGDSGSVDALIYAANDENKTVKGAAIRSLGYLSDTKAVETLIAAYGDNDQNISMTATESLKNYGEDAIEALSSALRTEDHASRENIARALDELNWVPETEESISYYLIAKKQWDELESIGQPALKPLSEALPDDDIDTRIAAVNAIAKIGGDDAVGLLAKAVCDKSVTVRKQAENAILEIGKPAVPVLENIVANARDPTERTFTMSLIRKIEN